MKQVRLPDGSPLDGENAVQIDVAGNVWTCNNWKPNFDIDTQG